MSFPRYPAYKASGVEWLGEVPEHWDVSSFRHCLSHMFNGLTATQVDEAEKTVPVTRIETISFGVIDESKLGFINLEDARADRLLMSGDILFSNINSLNMVGKCAFYAGGRTIYAGMNLLVLRPEVAKCDPLWLCWLVRSASFRDVVESLAKPAINQASVSQSSINSITVACPPLPEQTQITTFLDHETAKIDALVAEQRRLMELLKEKRQTVISNAVTRGLNPDAPMKPSGVEWLGDVPAHWDVLPIKRIVSVPITDGPHETPNFIDEGVPFVSAEAVSSGVINFSKVRACISEQDNARYSLKYAPKLHDIYMVKSGATTGVTAIVEGRTDFNIWSPLAAIRCNEGSVPHFVLNFMRSKHFQEAVTLNWSFGTQQNIGMGVIENLACTVPPVAEQQEIAKMLANESAKFDTLTAEAQRAIDLLQERRIALISAAVTGQIDVRGAVQSL